MGRRFEYKLNVWRSSTLTLGKPSPTGVVTGPFRVILFLVNELSRDLGIVVLCFFNALAPARCVSYSMFILAVLMIASVGFVTSGLIPSPGINVTVCFI